MSNALTLHDMSPGLRKVVGRESPRATLAEEPDAGNPLVRIWRGAELGNRSAYSTTAFSPSRPHLRNSHGRCGAYHSAGLFACLILSEVCLEHCSYVQYTH
jgi:hypothetical protein